MNNSSRVLKICIAAILIFSAIIIVNGRMKIRSINQEKDVILFDQLDLMEQLGDLKLELEDVQSDEFVENTAREKLGLIMPGEELIVIAEPATSGYGDAEQIIKDDIEIGD